MRVEITDGVGAPWPMTARGIPAAEGLLSALSMVITHADTDDSHIGATLLDHSAEGEGITQGKRLLIGYGSGCTKVVTAVAGVDDQGKSAPVGHHRDGKERQQESQDCSLNHIYMNNSAKLTNIHHKTASGCQVLSFIKCLRRRYHKPDGAISLQTWPNAARDGHIFPLGASHHEGDDILSNSHIYHLPRPSHL